MPAKPAGIRRPLFETIHALCAGIWLGSLLMSAATAGILFGTMRSLEPTFGLFDAYEGPQSDIGAGFIQNKVFLAGDIFQFVGAVGTLASTIMLIALGSLPLRRISTGMRLFALGAAMMLVSYHLFVLVPRMQTNAQAYWRAAEAGEMEAASAAFDAFQADHPTARSVMIATTIAVALMLGAGVWSSASPGVADRRVPGPQGTQGSQEPREPRLEEPRLATIRPGTPPRGTT